MAFNKEEYWKNKKDNIGSKREKSKPVPPKDLEIGFTPDGGFYAINREKRRNRKIIRLFTRKGYIEYLNKIRIKRSKNGKPKYKYVDAKI